jgi:peptidoglycan/xylan/chitin deacetylase (PgdA/CDA1 family)
LKLKHLGIATMALVIIAGGVMISPLYYHPAKAEPRQKVMLAFSVTEPNGVMGWCDNLSQVLFDHGIGATLFMVGKVAEEYPDAVWYFSNEVDVGSQTFDNVALTGIADYTVRLEEVNRGKQAVDDVGTVNSKLFRAPFGATDGDIFSLLGRSGILADFSYNGYYNVFRDDKFVKYDAQTFNAADITPEQFAVLTYSPTPLIVFFENTMSVSKIDSFIASLENAGAEFVNASQLTGLTLTVRGK